MRMLGRFSLFYKQCGVVCLSRAPCYLTQIEAVLQTINLMSHPKP